MRRTAVVFKGIDPGSYPTSGGQECPLHASKNYTSTYELLLRMNSVGYRRGIRLFNERKFYDAHEVWEDVWRECDGLEKKFLQGLIQAAVAFHHYSTGNVAGAFSLMERSRKNLAACPEEYGGIRVTALLESLGQWRTALAAGGARPVHPEIVAME